MKNMTLEEFLSAAQSLARSGKWRVQKIAGGHIILTPIPEPPGFIHCDLVTAVCLEQTGLTRKDLIRLILDDPTKDQYFEWTMAAELLGLPFVLFKRIIQATSSRPPLSTFTYVLRQAIGLPIVVWAPSQP